LSLWPSPPSSLAGFACLVNAYTPISSVSFPWGYLHSKAWLSKEAHCMLQVLTFQYPPSMLPFAYILLPPSDIATSTAGKTVLNEQYFHLPIPPLLRVCFIIVFRGFCHLHLLSTQAWLLAVSRHTHTLCPSAD